MKVSEQNLKLSMPNKHRGRTWYSSHSQLFFLHSSYCEVLHYYKFISGLCPFSQIQQIRLLSFTGKESLITKGNSNDMYSAVTDSKSFSLINISTLCLLTVAQSNHNLTTCVLTACLHIAILWEKWRSHCGCLESANMTAAVSPTLLRTTACVITSVHHFISWGPTIMKAFGMCDAQCHSTEWVCYEEQSCCPVNSKQCTIIWALYPLVTN